MSSKKDKELAVPREEFFSRELVVLPPRAGECEVDLTKPYVNVFVGMEKDSHPHVKFGIASINITKTHAAEFNVGRSRVPRILLFKSTSREAEHIALPKGDEFPTGKELNVLLTGEFVDNPTDHYDNCKKQQLHGDEL